jgi:hypothetical protein
MIRRCVAPLAMLVTVLSFAAPVSAGVVAEEPVVTGKPDQFGPGAEDDMWVGWSQFTKPYFRAHIRTLDGTDHRKFHRRSGSHSFFGGFDPSSEDVLFQDAKLSTASSNLYLYHVDTDSFGAPPDGVNTELWEWAPDISAAFILFGRNKFNRASSPWKVILYDRTLQTFKVLDSASNRCGCIQPESVSEGYAAWTTCAGIRCQVWVYEAGTGTPMKVPNPNDKQQYGAAVTDDGQVYFVRSGNTCGANAQIRRWDVGPGSTSTLVYDYPSGTDLRGGLDVVDGADTNDDLYFDRFDCGDRRFRGNIYRIVDANQILHPELDAEVGSGAGAAAGAWRGSRLVGARPS